MLALLACACPSFEETRVVDGSTGLPEGMLAEAQRAVDDFARWTARDGVCVPEVEIVDEVVDPFVGEVGGRYNTVTKNILMSAEYFDMHEGVSHELCHALDAELDLSDGAPELFPPEALVVEGPLTDEGRRHEVFAYRCMEQAQDHGIALAYERACEEELLDEFDRFFAERVFPGANFAVSEVPFPARVRARALPIDIRPGRLVAATAHDGEIVALVRGQARAGSTLHWLVFIDPDGGVVRRVRAELAEGAWYGAFYASDAEPYLVLSHAGWDQPLAWHLVGETLTPARPPDLEFGVGPGVVREGVAWYATAREVAIGEYRFEAGELRAMRVADGTAVDVPPPAERTTIRSIAQGPDGIELLAKEGHFRLVGDTWEVARAPENLRGLLFVGEQRLAIPTTLPIPVFEDDGAWALPDEPCGGDEAYGEVAVQLGERAFLVGNGTLYGWLTLYEFVLD